METKKNRKRLFLSLISAFIIGLFLSGKIINIPRGTHEGGMIAAIGVAVIIISIIVIVYLIRYITNKYKNK